ncbi:MAG: murein biosynthesis integral membrane protein MurJ [Dehalococcoidia bacterium]
MAEPAAAAPTAGPSRSGGLVLAAAIVGFGFLGSRLLGVVRTAAIADAFGSSPELGAFNLAFRIPDLIFQVLAGATLGSAFIPVFARLYRRDGPARAWRLASTMLNLVTTGTALLCLVSFVLAPLLVPLLAPDLGKDIGRHDELIDEAVKLTRIMLLSPFLFAISGMVTGILNGRQRFVLTALAPMLYNLAIIFGALVLAGPFGVEGLAIGVVVGSGLHLLVQVPGLFREKMRYRPSFDWRDGATREVGRLMGPRVLGLAAAQFNFLITTFFASKISSSAFNDLNYAWLLAQLPLALFGMALSTAVFPRLAENAADGDYAALQETLSRVLRLAMFLTIPAAVGLAMLRVPVVTLLLEHGEFTAVSTAITASALGWYCLGLLPQAGIEVHSRGFYALGDTRTPVILAVGAVLVNLALSAVLYGPFEHEGLAFAISFSSWLEWMLLYRLYCRRTGAAAARDLRAIALFGVCAAVMAMTIAVGFAPFDTGGRFDNSVIAIAGAVAGGVAYAAVALALRIPEFEQAIGRLRAMLGRVAAGRAVAP